MGRVLDLAGKRFTRLLVIKRIENFGINSYWECLCDCGKVKNIIGVSLTRGLTRSCGCYLKDIKRLGGTHYKANHTLYRTYYAMVMRCTNVKDAAYQNYGGRGIRICARWLESFEKFYEDVVDGWKPKLQLDRIDNDGDYCPENCRWVTRRQNQWNKGAGRKGASKFKGVYASKRKSGNKWQAQIKKGDEVYCLGAYDSEVKAAKAYNDAAKQLFGEYAYLNKIPEDI
jgi:hypothetical protein